MNPSEIEVSAVLESPYGCLFGNTPEEATASKYFQFYEKALYVSTAFAIIPEGEKGANQDNTINQYFKPNYEYDLLSSTAIKIKTPAQQLKSKYIETHRFRFADNLEKRLCPVATFTNSKKTFCQKRKFSATILEQFFDDVTRRGKNLSNTIDHAEIVRWCTSKNSCTLVAREYWPFSLDPCLALELFKHSSASKISQKPSQFLYKFDLNVCRHIHIQEFKNSEWIDLIVTEEFCREIFVDFEKYFECPQIYCKMHNISDAEKQRRMETNFTFLLDTIEPSIGNPWKPDEDVTVNLSNLGLTTFIGFGVENVTGTPMNYSDSYTGDYRNPNNSIMPLKHASLGHAKNNSVIFEQLPPEMLTSPLITSGLNSLSSLPGLFGHSFIGIHNVGEFLGGLYTFGCKTQLVCKLNDKKVLDSKSRYLLRSCCLVIRKLTYNTDGTFSFDLEKD